MIIVNIKSSYPALIESAGGAPANSDLAEITLGDWPKIRRENVMPYLDMVCGTYDGRVVTAFPAEDFDYVGQEMKIRFQPWAQSDRLLQWSRQWAWLIGVSAPGGAWRVGESRGTRRVDTNAYLQGEGAPYINRPAPQDVQTAMAEMAAFTHGLTTTSSFTPAGATDELASSPVDVVTSPSGEVMITVRSGTPFTLTVK